jgi:prolyl-tRNA editing enzyme YbaK/EbsC (Cys-tRNA(Pro) deacylase)
MQVLSPKHLQQVLDSFNLDLQSVQYHQPTATSELAAAAIGCEVAQIAKSICFVVTDEPILVVASGINTVDDRKLSNLLEVGRKKVKLAKPEQCIEIFGYAPGGVPPVGHRAEGIRIFLDKNLQQFERIWAAGGTANINFDLTPDQLEQITSGIWADIVKD